MAVTRPFGRPFDGRVPRITSHRRLHLRWLRSFAGRVASASSVKRLLEMPLTVLGFVSIDAAAAWWDPIVGLFSAGVLLIVLELLIADPSEGGDRE